MQHKSGSDRGGPEVISARSEWRAMYLKRSSSGKAISNARLQSGLQAIEEIGTIRICNGRKQ